MLNIENRNILTPPIDWFLFDKDSNNNKPISTFIPEVLSEIKVHTAQGSIAHIRLMLHFKSGQSEEYIVPLSDIENMDWFQQDKRCLLNPHYHHGNEYIANIIRSGLMNAPIEEEQCLDRLGIHHIDNKIVFVAGDRIITSSSDNVAALNIQAAILPFKLDINPMLSPKEAFDGMRELVCLSSEIGRVLVAHVISGITRSAFKEVGFTPCAVLVIVGKTGMLKSHYVPHMSQLYNRNSEIRAVTRFNSTQRFIEDILNDYSECTAVIDDLHSAESRGIKKINETTAEEIIRRIGDDTGRGHKEGNALVQKKFRGNAVFIGEYTIGKESTLPRALVVNITVPPNSVVLDKYQRHQPLIISTFYYYFIKWYVEHFNDIRNEIDERLTKFREMSVTGVHLRLKDTQFYLQTSYMLFLEFCKNSSFITEKEAQDEYRSFRTQLVKLIQAQQARISLDNEKPKKLNYLKLIRDLYKSNRFRLAENAEKFDQNKHDGLIYYECLCLRGKNLDKIIHKEFRNFKHYDMINDLLSKDALKLVAKKNTVQIRQLNGLRFYAIGLNLLD